MSCPIRGILYAEDNPGDARLALDALERVGLNNELVVVEDGVHALDYLCARGNYSGRAPCNPAVVLLDLKLPRVSGLDVLKQIRSNPALKLVPVVVLSFSVREDDMIRAYELGANGYLFKAIEYKIFRANLYAFAEYWLKANQPPPVARPC